MYSYLIDKRYSIKIFKIKKKKKIEQLYLEPRY